MSLGSQLGVDSCLSHTTYSSSSVSWATSGMVMVPDTSSTSGAEPVQLVSPTKYAGARQPVGCWHEPVYSKTSFTSKMVMTLPLRWLTSTSPSMLWTLLILALTSPFCASRVSRFWSNQSLAHWETSLFTQCQLLGLCRTIVSMGSRAAGERTEFSC